MRKKYHIDCLPYGAHKRTPFTFDDNGVILTRIPYTNNYDYHLTEIASYVIDTSDKHNLNWILENIDDKGTYYHKFTFPFYPMKKGWVGGLAQGLTLSALVAHGYIDEAQKVLSALKLHCYNGTCINEYPKVEILNGWIYALFGVYDIDDKAFFDKNIELLKKRLPSYNLKYMWSKYDSYTHYPATEFYHVVHLKQMRALFELTYEDIFLDYYNMWKKQLNSPICRTWSKYKKVTSSINTNGFINSYKRYKTRKRWLNEI